LDEVVESVIRGFQQGSGGKLVGGLIICALRSYGDDHFQETIDLTNKYLGKGVVGFDIAGDEGSFPLNIHRKYLEIAVKSGIPVTCHAGEWPNSAENVKIAVDVGVARIGHGLILQSSPNLMKEVSNKKIAVECCVIANHGWKDKTWINKHPIKEMFNSGICCSINSDNQLLGGTLDRKPNTIEDIIHLVSELEFSWQDIKIILLNGVKSSFTKLDPNWIKSFEKKIDEIIPVE